MRAHRVSRIEQFRDNPFKTKFAGSREHFGTITLNVLDVLNTPFHRSQGFAQCRWVMSAFTPKADIPNGERDVRFGS